MKKFSKMISILLVLCVVLTLMPNFTFKAEAAVKDGWLWPVENHTNIASPYGYRWLNGNLGFHYGIDIEDSTIMGQPVLASKGGRISQKSCNCIHTNYSKANSALYDYNINCVPNGCSSLGNYITIDHPDGSRTVYGHMQQAGFTAKKIGENVEKGEQIGIVGSSGKSTGPHLHFQINKPVIKPTDPTPGVLVNYIYKLCDHLDYKDGKCLNPDCLYSFPSDYEKISGYSGKYKVIAKGANLRKAPYAASALIGNTSLPIGQKLEVVGAVKNRQNSIGPVHNIWLLTDKNQYICYETKELKRIGDLTSKISISCPDVPKSPHTKGRLWNLNGEIISTYNLSSVSAFFTNVDTKAQIGKVTKPTSSRSYRLNKSELDMALSFGGLPVGTYTITIEAKDLNGVTEAFTSKAFSVGLPPPKQCSNPTYKVVPVLGGKNIEITAQGNIQYTINGIPGSAANFASITTKTDAVVTAKVTAPGKIDSGEVSFYVEVDLLRVPEIIGEAVPNGKIISLVSIPGAKIYYKIDGGAETEYTGPIKIEKTSTIIAYARAAGYADSEVSTISIVASAPESPLIKLAPTCTSIMAQGKVATAIWDAVPTAANYVATLKKGTDVVQSKTVDSNSISFPLDEVGEYSIIVKAVNSIGESKSSNSIPLTSKAPATVTFVDFDNTTVLSKVSVPYCDSAPRPQNPIRKGYTFDAWEGNFSNVTSDLTIKATYIINTYTVSFYNSDGTTLINRYDTEFGSTVKEPAAPAASEGYSFMGWRLIEGQENKSGTDGKQLVESNLKYVAVYKWANENIPITVKITSVNRDQTVSKKYTAQIELTNNLDKVYSGKVIVVLKEGNDRVGATAMAFFTAASKGTESKTIEITCAKEVSLAEVYVVGFDENEKTGGAAAIKVSSSITSSTSWSAWSETKPVGQTIIDEMIEYSYSDKIKATGSSNTMDGFTLVGDPTYVLGAEWSSENGNLATNDVHLARTVTTPAAYKTQYQYWGYTTAARNGWHFCNQCYRARNVYNESQWYDCEQAFTPFSDGAQSCAHGYSGITGRWILNGQRYYHRRTRDVQTAAAKTTYYYQNKIYTYNFEKDSEWSAWSVEPVVASADRQVKTRILYRYQINTPVTTTPEVVTPIVRSGVVTSAVDLNGKKAALMVYRGTNSDPTKDQLEYVGETTIGAGNTYSISFPAKSGAPTKDTGDYIVTLGVEGATNLYNIEIIKAPVTSYTVTFYDGDGKPIGEPLSVEEGKSATAPEAPVKTGHRFLKWDKGFTNVSKDIAVTAIYEKEKFTVAFVDWQNDTLVLQDAEYGSSLAAPAGKSSEGYTFTSWDKDVTNVTSSMVVTAQYAPKVFNVTFARAIQNDNTILPADIISEQQIKYGESAALPAPIAEEGKVFRGWSTNVCWWKVESDVVVTPIFEYAETTMQPVTDKGSIVTGMQDEIELVAEEGAKIYYTTDGSDPTEPATSGSVDASDTSNTTKEYTGPIPVTESTVIKAISVAPKKNISEVMEVVFVYDDDDYDDDEVPEEKVEIATYPVIAEAGKEITLELLIENNPGISMYQFFIECDTNVFYAKCDNVSGDYLAQTGEVSKNGSLLLAPYENKGWTAIWFSPLNTEMNGKLLSIKLGVTDGVTTGEHPIKISYSPKNTCTIDYEEKALDGIGVQVLNDSGKLMGDANGDKRVNLADAVRIARYIVALSDIPEARRFAADVNRDNQITIADAICIARHVAGIELMK